MMMTEKEILVELNELNGWEFIDSKIVKFIERGNQGKHLGYVVKKIWDAAERADHHPDILLTYAGIKITLFTHDESWVTPIDINFARDLDVKLKYILHPEKYGLNREN